MPVASRGEWLNPLNRLIWQRAFKAKEPTMTLRNGQKFSITYDCNGRMGKAWVQIVKGYEKSGFDPFTPCGWFDYKEVTDPQWVKGDSSDKEPVEPKGKPLYISNEMEVDVVLPTKPAKPVEKRKSATEMIAELADTASQGGDNGKSEQD